MEFGMSYISLKKDWKYTKNNRDQVAVKSFVEVIQTFKILKPVYKVDGDSYERI